MNYLYKMLQQPGTFLCQYFETIDRFQVYLVYFAVLRGSNTKKKFVCFNAVHLWSGVRTWYHKHKNKFFKVTIAMVTMLITPSW